MLMCFNVVLNHLFHVSFTSDTYDQDRRAIILTRAFRAKFIILDEENMHVNNYLTMILMLSYLRMQYLRLVLSKKPPHGIAGQTIFDLTWKYAYFHYQDQRKDHIMSFLLISSFSQTDISFKSYGWSNEQVW